MSHPRLSLVLWSIRLAVSIAGLSVWSGDVMGQLTLTVGTTGASCNATDGSNSDGNVTAIATGGTAPYSYTLDGTFGTVTNSTGIFTGYPAGQYVVTVTDATSATVSNFDVYISSGCMMVATNVKDATCGNANGKITITATGGAGSYQYSIDGVDFFSTNIFTNVAGGIYTVLVEDANGNITTALTRVGDLLGPTVTTTVGPASCLNNDGTVGISTSGGTSPFLYSINGSPFGSSPQFSDVASGTETVTVQDANGCQSSAVATVPLNNNLTLTVTPGYTICQGTSTTLQVTSNAGAYAWTPTSGLSNAATADPAAEPSTTTTYDVTATLEVCTLTGSATVTVLPAPVASAGASDTICPGKSAQLSGSGGVAYQWSPAIYLSDPTSADPTVQQPAKSTTYSLTVTGANGCASIEPATEEVFVTPQPVVFAGDDTAVLEGQPVPLDAIDVNNSGFTSYQWSPASGLNNSLIQDPTAQITQDITYMVVATTADGCSGTGSIVIAVASNSNIVVPNAFTPNGDGHNDVLRADAIGIRDFKYFSIFNRWGQEMFTTANQGIGWDGTRGGTVQAAGVYVWAAAGVDFSGRVVERKGMVILIR